MKNCKPLVLCMLSAAILSSCSIREDRSPCYGDPMLSVGPSELVLDVDDGPVALEISTLSPSAIGVSSSDTSRLALSFDVRSGRLLLLPRAPGGPVAVTIRQEESEEGEWYRASSLELSVVLVDTVKTALILERTFGILDEGGRGVLSVSSNSPAAISWTLSNPSVLRMEDDSTVTALSYGECRVTVTQEGYTDGDFVTWLPAESSVFVGVVAVPKILGGTVLRQGGSDTLWVSDPSRVGWSIECSGLSPSKKTSRGDGFVLLSAGADLPAGEYAVTLYRGDTGESCDMATVTLLEREKERPRFLASRLDIYKEPTVAGAGYAGISDADGFGWTLRANSAFVLTPDSGCGGTETVKVEVPADLAYGTYYLYLASTDGRTVYGELLVCVKTYAYFEDASDVVLKRGESLVLNVLDISHHGWGVSCWSGPWSRTGIPDGVSIWMRSEESPDWKNVQGVPSNRTYGSGQVRVEADKDAPECSFRLLVTVDSDGRTYPEWYHIIINVTIP